MDTNNAPFKIYRKTDNGRLLVAYDRNFLYVHDHSLRKSDEPFFHYKIENNSDNQYFYSSANPHDNLIDESVPKNSFTSLEEIEEWLKTTK